jgi:hypothetical protein
LAALAWCQPSTENIVMNADLAKEFARILMREVNQLECSIDLLRLSLKR